MTSVLGILVLIALFSVLAIVKQIMAQRKCLSDHQLRKFMGQRLKGKERDLVIAHLGICETCQTRLHEINFGKKEEDHLINEPD